MKINFKITRAIVIIGLLVIGIFLTFLTFWMYGETKLFNDTKGSYGVDFGWIHMAFNTVLLITDFVWLGFLVGELVSDKDDRPFRWLYKNDYDSRRSYREEPKEDKITKPFNWKRLIWLAIIFIIVFNIFKVGKVVYNQSVFMYNTSKKYQNTYQQKVEEKMGFYDKLWKTYQTKAEITNMNKDVFLQVTKIIMENVADGENLSWKWVSRYPDIDYNQFTAFYADLSNYITKQREGYFSIEKVCQQIANQNNTLLDTFPNNFYNRALKLPRIKFEYGFLSDSTNNVFRTKVENL